MSHIRQIIIIASLLATSCTTGPIQSLAPTIQADALTAQKIATLTGMIGDVQCFAGVSQVAGTLGPGNTIGILTIAELKRAAQASGNGPCAPIYLDMLLSLAQLGLKFTPIP
jgi:hypothetical protein